MALLDAAEQRAARAVAEKATEKRRADDAEAELRALKLQAPVAPTLRVESAPPPDNTLILKRNGKKFVVPIGLILAAAPFVATLGQRIWSYERQAKELTAAVAGYEKRLEEQNDAIKTMKEGQDALRVTVAKMSGYLDAVLPKAGVVVTRSEPGAIQMDIETDQQAARAWAKESVSTKKSPKVFVRTPVPAPPPRAHSGL